MGFPVIKKTPRWPEATNRQLSINEACTLLGVSSQTLRNWETEGKLTVERTSGGHRRYSEEEINKIRKIRMGDNEIIIPNVTVAKILEMTNSFFSGLDPCEQINITINTNRLDRKITFTVDSNNGLETRSKAFKMED